MNLRHWLREARLRLALLGERMMGVAIDNRTVMYEDMTPEQKKQFYAGFEAFDKAFHEMDNAFSKFGGVFSTMKDKK